MNTKCHLCDGKNAAIIRTTLRYDIRRNVLRCRDCGLVFLEPRPANMENYYAGDYRKRYTPTLGKAMGSKEIFDMLRPYQEARIKELKHVLRPGIRVLEVGSSAGYFLHAIKPLVAECVGIEFNRENAEFARGLGIKTYTEPIEKTDLQSGSFDLIVLLQVLEHIKAPITFLANLRRYLKDDGYICVEVPNMNDALLSVYKVKPFADFWFIDPHLYYFTTETLGKVMVKSGFSGKVKSTQEYNFLNHLHWILTGSPQPSATIGMSTPHLVTSPTCDPALRNEFNNWMKKVDDEYRSLLVKWNVGGKLLFIGKTDHQ